MSNFDNTNRGILSRNKNKTEDKHPEFSGSLNVDGTDFWLSAWVKESSKDGSRVLRLPVRCFASR